MSSHDQRNQNVNKQYNIVLNSKEGEGLYSTEKPTDIIAKRKIKFGMTGGGIINHEVSFKLKNRHEILLIYEWYLTKQVWNPFQVNPFNCNISLVVDGETKIALNKLSFYTFDHDELGFVISNEDVNGKLVLGGSGILWGRKISILIGDHISHSC